MAVGAVVARAMAKDPAERYGSCEELVHELESALDLPAMALLVAELLGTIAKGAPEPRATEPRAPEPRATARAATGRKGLTINQPASVTRVVGLSGKSG